VTAPLEPEPLRIIVTDLIDHGLINAPVTVFGTYSAKRLQARLMPDGTFVHRGNVYSSPSVAAGRAITAELGYSTSGRGYFAINGWKFWQVVCPDGIFESSYFRVDQTRRMKRGRSPEMTMHDQQRALPPKPTMPPATSPFSPMPGPASSELARAESSIAGNDEGGRPSPSVTRRRFSLISRLPL
jgi:hypothetical protein